MKIVESVRDAMQGVKEFIPTRSKIEYINLLLKIGFDVIDFSSFVSKRQIPQLKDVAEVLEGLDISKTNTKLLALVGSQRGAERACAFEKIDYIAYPFSISETFLKYNLNSDFDKSIKTIEYNQDLSIKTGKELTLYFAMAFGNPYGDEWSSEIVFKWLDFFRQMGIKQISFSDPAAVANKETISQLFAIFKDEYSDSGIELGIHIHSEPDNWYEKVDAAYKNGCRRFDTVINGFGGCPMSKKKLVGNLKTGDLLSYLDEGKKVYNKLDMNAYKLALEKANEIFKS
ncbi:MAG: hydroxymethylglutaryl-CoA lyase [Candidatus Cloacimonetes bacterium]|nr:hydroxymethylglutaryl-CoA lyase [Candidatus Cloacimonadota bacterium]